ncbi:MAG TPA: anaerobic glycerol-3-phosphate dehydrogenase subunit C [Gaiellales bacterium]|jgi:glycerol-3-phosphate dehydrogenase subunit C
MSVDIRGSLDNCVKCTVCETFCPVAAATPLFPGPKYAGPQSERYRRDGTSVDASLDYCSGCGICTQVCPQGVDIAEINARARAEMKTARGMPLRDRLIARPPLLGRLTHPVAPIANAVTRSRPGRRALQAALGIHRDAALPAYSRTTFQSWARKHRPPAGTTRTVVYFHGCAANYNEPSVGRMAVEVLEHNGFEVIVPPQGCCGLPLQSNGAFEPAREYVRALVGRLAPYAREGHMIVANSTSCGLMLKREAREILGMDDDDLALVGSRTFDICELLRDLLDEGELRTDMRALPMRVPYHQPCQGRGHGFGKPALDLLDLIPELEVIETDRECCGVAGTYGLKVEKYPIAMQVGAPLFADIAAARADCTACDSETCRWHIAKATGLPSVHPLELLHRAYGLS